MLECLEFAVTAAVDMVSGDDPFLLLLFNNLLTPPEGGVMGGRDPLWLLLMLFGDDTVDVLDAVVDVAVVVSLKPIGTTKKTLVFVKELTGVAAALSLSLSVYLSISIYLKL